MGKRVSIIGQDTNWIALIGMPISIKAGEYKIIIKTINKTWEQLFVVGHKDYPTQYISIKKPRMVDGFTTTELKKIKADKKILAKAKMTWSNRAIDADFIPPVVGTISSSFGLKRYLNNIPKKPHNGLDIAAKTGMPIIAPASAKVIDVGNYYFNGKSIFLSHGQGLLSVYLHLDTIVVKLGDMVKQGQLLGTVGETGRASASHLHWTVYLNQIAVNPELFITNINI